MGAAFMDCLGRFKAKITRNKTKKNFYPGGYIVTCCWSRFSVFVILDDMSANSILMGLRNASYQCGGSHPLIVHSDSASNFLPISKIQDGQDETAEGTGTQTGNDSENKNAIKALNDLKVAYLYGMPTARDKIAINSRKLPFLHICDI